MKVRTASLLLAVLACGPSLQHANNQTATGGILITEERIKLLKKSASTTGRKR